MPGWLAVAVAALGKIGVSLLMSLLTESFAKKLILHALRVIAGWTETDVDNKIVEDIQQQWGLDK